MLTSAFKKQFDRTDLHEQQIHQLEEMIFNTSQQDVSTLTQYIIETRNHSADSFLYLDDAYLLVKWKLVKSADGTAQHADARTSLTHGAWSLFSRVSLDVNNSRIDYNDGPGHSFNILSKASKSKDWISDNAADLFYYPSGYSAEIANSHTFATNATDENFLVGALRTAASADVWARLPLKYVLGVCNTKKVWNGVNLTLRLEKQEAYAEILMRSAGGNDADCKTVIQEIQLVVPMVKAGPKLADEYAMTIRSKPVPIDFQQIYYQRVSGTGTSLNMNLFTGTKRPRHIFIAPQLKSVNDAQNAVNAGLYVSNAATQCFITINNVQYPFVAYRGANEGHQRAVLALKRAFGADKSGSSSIMVSTSNFAAYNSIYYFDCSHIDDLFEQNNANDVIVKITFVSSEANPQYFHCVVLSDQHMQLALAGGTPQLLQAP